MLLRAIIQGAPGSGKTALLASAANAGYRILLADFDHCPESLFAFTAPEHHANIYVIPFDDEVSFNAEEGISRNPKALIAFERFLYTGRANGQEYGKPTEWGPETILCLDTLTALGDAAEVRSLALNPTTREGRHLWQAAQEQEAACQLMVSNRMHCHSLVLSHVRLISPKAESGYKDETELQKQVKRERAQLEETGYFPTAVTPGIARNFVRHFPFALLVEEDLASKAVSKRVVRTVPVLGYQIKCPVVGIADKLPIETALTTLLEKINPPLLQAP